MKGIRIYSTFFQCSLFFNMTGEVACIFCRSSLSKKTTKINFKNKTSWKTQEALYAVPETWYIWVSTYLYVSKLRHDHVIIIVISPLPSSLMLHLIICHWPRREVNKFGSSSFHISTWRQVRNLHFCLHCIEIIMVMTKHKFISLSTFI